MTPRYTIHLRHAQGGHPQPENLSYEVSIPEEIETLNFNQYRQVLSGMNRIIYIVRRDTSYIHIIIDDEA